MVIFMLNLIKVFCSIESYEFPLLNHLKTGIPVGKNITILGHALILLYKHFSLFLHFKSFPKVWRLAYKTIMIERVEQLAHGLTVSCTTN